MKLNAKQVSSMNKSLRAWFLFGPAAGMVEYYRDRIISTIRKTLPSHQAINTLTLSYGDLAKNPEALASELANYSLMGEISIVIIRGATATITPELKAVLDQYLPHGLHYVIILAGDLPPSSAFRKYAEQHEHIGAVGCYEPNNAEKLEFIRSYLVANSLRASQELVTWIAVHLPNDFASLSNELDKLALYYNQAPAEIEVNVARTLLGNNTEGEASKLILAIGEARIGRLCKGWEHLERSGINAVTFIRYLMRHWLRMWQIVNAVKSGATQQEAFSALKPPVFFAEKPAIVSQLLKLDTTKAAHILEKLYQAEAECKRSYTNTNLIILELLRQLHLIVTAVRNKH